jgi:hypothetical protein
MIVLLVGCRVAAQLVARPPVRHASGPVEPLDCQAFRESAHQIDTLVVRFNQQTGVVYWPAPLGYRDWLAAASLC